MAKGKTRASKQAQSGTARSSKSSSSNRGGHDAETDNIVAGGDFLSESHTIAEEDSELASFSALDHDFDDLDAAEGYDTDHLIQRGNDPTSKVEAALAATNRLQSLQDLLTTLDDYTTEKRSAKREARLRAYFKGITHSATGETGYSIVSHCTAQLLTACTFSLRPGQSASEQYAACRVLEAASVALGAHEEDWITEGLDPPLRRTVMATARATPVRAAALRALCLGATICAAQDSVVLEQLQDLCEAVAALQYRQQTVPAALRATALDCWALLATLQDDVHLAGQDDVQTGRGVVLLELLRDCLEDPNTELRSAAGQCLALIHEARLHLGVAEDAEQSELVNTTARKYQQGSWEDSPWEELMDEVKQRIAELSVESGHHLSKKVKKEQRATFREYMATVVDNEAPELELHFRNQGSLTLNTWKEIVQLNFVRHCLQSGFQIQLLTNATLQSMFGAAGLSNDANNANASLSQVEKRLLLSKGSEASKMANLNRRGKRDKRENVKNHFLTADGDDI